MWDNILGQTNDDYAVVIDPSHGGSDIGQTGNGIIEKDLVLDISNYIYSSLNGDETIINEERVERILNAYGNHKNVIVLPNYTNVSGSARKIVMYEIFGV